MFFFFFFQAEDGIRDSSVTGVQTCALPISPERIPTSANTSMPGRPKFSSPGRNRTVRNRSRRPLTRNRRGQQRKSRRSRRTGEGRVGEEGRTRGAPDHLKKKKKKRE